MGSQIGSNNRIHLVGFGSQGRAWACALREMGWSVDVYLKREGKGFEAARAEGFKPKMLSELTRDLRETKATDLVPVVAILVPDAEIGGVYQEFVSFIPRELVIAIGHGYAVYSGDLKVQPQHAVALFAPKAIGPQLTKKFLEGNHPHDLVAACCFPSESGPRKAMEALATSLGFSQDNCVQVSFDQETIGDLISEQGLLCGGLFTLFEWTLEAVARELPDMPPKLLRAECLTELGLIVQQMIDQGPTACFKKISQAAQCGSVMTKSWMEDSGAKKLFERQVQAIVQGEFAKQLKNPQWRSERDAWLKKLESLEEKVLCPK